MPDVILPRSTRPKQALGYCYPATFGMELEIK